MRKVYIAGAARTPFAAVDQVGAVNFRNYLRKKLIASGKHSREEIPKLVEEMALAAKKFLEEARGFEEMTGLTIKTEYPPNEGSFAKIPAMDLTTIVLNVLFKNLGAKPECVDVFRLGSVIVPKTDEGWVHAAAKVIALKSGMKNADSDTLDKACSSGLEAIGLAYEMIANCGAHIAVACGVDKMSGVPDRLVRLGLTNPFDGKLMAGLVDKVAQEFGLTREALDDYAFGSRERAYFNQTKHKFIVPIGNSNGIVDYDEEVYAHPVTRKLLSRLPTYPESEEENAPRCKLVTAGNSAAYADGCGAVILADREGLRVLKSQSLAEIMAFARASGGEPKDFILKPEEAIERCLVKTGLEWKDLGHIEDNEAFAVGNVLLMNRRSIERERMNRRGGAIAHGHAIGCTGCSLTVKSIDIALQDGDKYYVVAACNAVDEATALLLKNPRA